MKKPIYNKNEAQLTPKAKLLIASIANKETREYLESFVVYDIEKVSIRDVESNSYMHYTAPQLNEPKFNKDTPLELQKILIDAYLFQKQNNGFLYTTMVDIDLLWPAICQRTLDLDRVTKIAKEFSVYKFTPINLVYMDGKLILEIEDGQHHAAAGKMLNIPKLPCTISFGKTEEESSSNFESQDDLKSRLKQHEKYYAGLKSGYIDCVAIDRVCNLFRIKMANNRGAYPQTISSIRAIRKIVREYGEVGLRFVFQFLVDAGWYNQDRAYEEPSLNIGYSLLEIIKDNKGEFDYDAYLKDVSKYKNIVEYIDYMRHVIGTHSIDRHPEKTPGIYLTMKYGK